MKFSTRAFLLFFVIFVGVTLTFSYAKPKSEKSKASGIQGEIVRIGFAPINPEDCPDCPVPGQRILIPGWAVVVRRASDGSEVKRIKTDKDGKFKLALPVGKYKVVADPDDMGGVPNYEQIVTVQPNKFKYVWVVFDGGW